MPELNLRPGIYIYIGVCSCRALESAIKMEYGDSRRGRGPSKAVARDCINVRNFVKRERSPWDCLAFSLFLSLALFFFSLRFLWEHRNSRNNLAVVLTSTVRYHLLRCLLRIFFFECYLTRDRSKNNQKRWLYWIKIKYIFKIKNIITHTHTEYLWITPLKCEFKQQ